MPWPHTVPAQLPLPMSSGVVCLSHGVLHSCGIIWSTWLLWGLLGAGPLHLPRRTPRDLPGRLQAPVNGSQ